jgi:hypothetical protein
VLKKEMFNHHLLQRKNPGVNLLQMYILRKRKKRERERERENKGKYKEIKRQRE